MSAEVVIVEKSCPECGKHISTEIPRDDFFDSAVRLYKTAACWVCYEYQRRLLNVGRLKSEIWIHLRKAEAKQKSTASKAGNSSRYGSQSGSSYQDNESSQKVNDLRGQMETLDKKEQTLVAEREEYKTEQKGTPNEKQV